MECEICKVNISIIDWLFSPEGRKMCIDCRGIYIEEEKKMKEQMFKKVAERLEKRRKH